MRSRFFDRCVFAVLKVTVRHLSLMSYRGEILTQPFGGVRYTNLGLRIEQGGICQSAILTNKNPLKCSLAENNEHERA